MKHAQRDFITVGLVAIAGAATAWPRLKLRLSAEDLIRAERFRLAEDRARFVLGRALLARLLADELDYRPDQLELTLTEHGRPVLPLSLGINFSISHAGAWVGVALAAGAEVGLDIESLDRHADFDALADRVFNETDLLHFRALGDGAKIRAFFRAWTGKEAVLKAAGIGLFGGVRNMSVPLNDVAAIWEDPAPGGPTWHVQPLAMPDGYLSSLASSRGGPVPLQRWFTLDDLG